MLANVKGQLLWGVIKANFPEVKSTFPADDSLSILGGILHPTNHRAQVPFITNPISTIVNANLR